jgi:predicted esterase
MEQVRVRRLGVKGWLYLLSGLAIAIGGEANTAAAETTKSASAPTQTREPAPRLIELAETPNLPGVVIFPARVSGPRPITVVLHGMCGDPSRTCSHFAEQVTVSANLVCPLASEHCAGGGASWPQAGFAQAVEAAVERAKAALPEPADDEQGRTLIGYSLGAYRALEIAQSTPGKYPRVMLIGARISLNQQRLAQNGVRRVLLSAGGWDMMHDPMQREAQRALRNGIRARFLDLGPVGHTFTPSFAGYLPAALSWLNES